MFGAGSAWTLWAQEQVGAVKGGLTPLPTINLTFDALLSYSGKVFVPAWMSASYNWSSYPYVSAKGVLGATLICGALCSAMYLAGSLDRNRRLIAFGVFWFLIALTPVANVVQTSTKMADRYLFVPSVGAILVLLAGINAYLLFSRRTQLAACACLGLAVFAYTAWSYSRAEVWCGKTTPWRGRPQPDLSLWTSAVGTDPNDPQALTSLGLAYLRLSPPEPDMALLNLNRALQSGEARQGRIAGDRHVILAPVYDALGDAYLVKAASIQRVGVTLSLTAP